MEVDVKEIKKEFEEKKLIETHKKLTFSRRMRRLVLGHLLAALILTVVYGTLENPFQYTLSGMGNHFTVSHRVFFIVWGGYVGFAFFTSLYALHRLEDYNKPTEVSLLFFAWMSLIVSTLIPSVPQLPTWKFLHIVTAVLFSAFLGVGSLPFLFHVARENPRLKKTIYAWIALTYGGGVVWFILLGNTGMFEMWAIALYLILMLIVSMMLFEESIIKYCVEILKDEKDINVGIEKAYADLDEADQKDKVRLIPKREKQEKKRSQKRIKKPNNRTSIKN